MMKTWGRMVALAAVFATTGACKQPPTPATGSGAPAVVVAPVAVAPADAPALDAAVASDAPAAVADAAVVEGPPDVRARRQLQAQLDALPADDKALRATFRPDALVLTQEAFMAADTTLRLAPEVSRVEAPGELLRSRRIDKLVAGAAPGVVWFSAEVTLEAVSDVTIKHRLRVLELLDGASQDRAAVAAVGDVEKKLYRGEMGPLVTRSAAGPLARLLIAPGEAATALADDPAVVVMGTAPGEVAVGPAAARGLLERWRTLPMVVLGDSVHEVHTPTYGYAVASIEMPPAGGGPSEKMLGLIIALPRGDGWAVVGIHYLPP